MFSVKKMRFFATINRSMIRANENKRHEHCRWKWEKEESIYWPFIYYGRRKNEVAKNIFFFLPTVFYLVTRVLVEKIFVFLCRRLLTCQYFLSFSQCFRRKKKSSRILFSFSFHNTDGRISAWHFFFFTTCRKLDKNTSKSVEILRVNVNHVRNKHD